MNDKQIQQLQIIEQNLQSFLMQKQQVQQEIKEIESALNELTKTETAYKIIGNIMINTEKEDIVNELNTKKELFLRKLEILNDQESKIKKKAEELREEMIKSMEKKNE